jgi:UrcA family protein
MTERTCAACDCVLDANPIKVKVGGKTVEVCCDDCASKLNESQASAKAASKGLSLVAAAVAVGVLFFAQPERVDAAESVDLTPHEHVFYGDLDLTQKAGVQRLYARLGQAARKVCASYTNSVRRDYERLRTECIAKALSEAVSDIGDPALTEHYASRQSRKTPPLQAKR